MRVNYIAINAYNRLPIINGNYFCLCNGTKELLTKDEIENFVDRKRYNEFYWYEQISEKNLMEKIVEPKFNKLFETNSILEPIIFSKQLTREQTEEFIEKWKNLAKSQLKKISIIECSAKDSSEERNVFNPMSLSVSEFYSYIERVEILSSLRNYYESGFILKRELLTALKLRNSNELYRFFKGERIGISTHLNNVSLRDKVLNIIKIK